MSNITVLPKSISQIKESAHAALEEFQGSPIKKKGKVNAFLKTLLGYKNEHEMDADLKKPRNGLARVSVKTIVVTTKEHDDRYKEVDSRLIVCGKNKESYEMINAFLSEAPDSDMIIRYFLETTEFLERLDEGDPEELEVIQSIKAYENSFDFSGVVDLYVEHFGYNELGMILENLTEGEKTISLEEHWIDVEINLNEIQVTQ